MSDVFVTPPGWSWDIVLYFFFAGIAGGAYFVSSLLRLVAGEADRPLSRVGYYLAFPLLNVAAILLIKDLGQPKRFWHMVFQSEDFPDLMFKWWAPISFGTWIVTLFGLPALLSFLHALVEGGIWHAPSVHRWTRALHGTGRPVGSIFLIIGAVWGLMLGGYTGMLLMVNNAPTWSHDPMLPPMFMASAVATGAATIFLLAHLSGAGDPRARHRVLRTAALALAFEALLVLAAVLLGIGEVSPFFLGWWAAFFWVVVLPFGFIAPLAILLMTEYRGRDLVRNAPVVGAVLVLAGGFLLRLLEVFGGQAYFVPY